MSERFDQPQSTGGLDRVRPIGFVVFGCLFWFLFVTLARVVIKCAPTFQCTRDDLSLPSSLGWPDTAVLLTTLVLAIWASRRLVFPRED